MPNSPPPKSLHKSSSILYLKNDTTKKKSDTHKPELSKPQGRIDKPSMEHDHLN
uniref:Uncharacterized protein n=1 Tax=Rhizophora mucronata TaxID=61149 RepID=A0A2P2PYA4_RHIMU